MTPKDLLVPSDYCRIELRNREVLYGCLEFMGNCWMMPWVLTDHMTGHRQSWDIEGFYFYKGRQRSERDIMSFENQEKEIGNG